MPRSSPQISPRFLRLQEGKSLPEEMIRLLEKQRKTWPELTRGYASLASIQIKEVACDGFSVFVQFNPGRMVSTSAKVDEKSLRERKCFLCVENLPPEQTGILHGEEFVVLCNPAPIFQQHYTISHLEHRPQALEDSIETLLALARELSPEFIVFYNGPRCGASAPDHLHFQASPTGAIPIERHVDEPARRKHERTRDGVISSMPGNLGRSVLLLESKNIGELARRLGNLMDGLRNVLQEREEPMVNVLVSHANGTWKVIVFPRRKHRPDVYFREGEEKILVSPAAVDMGGLIITPRERDFHRIDAKVIEGIFKEVSLQENLSRLVLEEIA